MHISAIFVRQEFIKIIELSARYDDNRRSKSTESMYQSKGLIPHFMPTGKTFSKFNLTTLKVK